jgi:uncharacterized protein (UPF0335 family)
MSEPQASGHNGLLKSIVERIEHVEGEIADLKGDKGEIYQEAKSHGYCPKTLRRVVAFRKKDPAARAEEETLMETYLHALETGA